MGSRDMMYDVYDTIMNYAPNIQIEQLFTFNHLQRASEAERGLLRQRSSPKQEIKIRS